MSQSDLQRARDELQGLSRTLYRVSLDLDEALSNEANREPEDRTIPDRDHECLVRALKMLRELTDSITWLGTPGRRPWETK